jgi:hypothetical protein
MLIDQILNDPNWAAQTDALSNDLRVRLSRATKFVLQPDFAMAVDEFSMDMANADRALKLARLPYPECWFEVASEERKRNASLPPADGFAHTHRVGYLLTQFDQHSWSACLFWSFPDSQRGPNGFRLSPVASARQLILDLRRRTASEATSFRRIEHNIGPRVPLSGNQQDWNGEPPFLIGMLALLHAHNACESTVVDLTRPNKRRQQNGKLPLYSYRLLSIPPRYKQRNISTDREPLGRQLRAHFVRGHFKVRRTGIFFWSSHHRGNPVRGFIQKDYKVHAPGTRDTPAQSPQSHQQIDI